MIIKHSQGDKVNYDIANWIINDVEEISDIPECSIGSTVYIISTGEKWIKNDDNEWQEIKNDISAALNKIIEIQQHLIGGEIE